MENHFSLDPEEKLRVNEGERLIHSPSAKFESKRTNNPHKNHNSNKPLVLGSGRKGYGATRSTKGSPSGTRVMQVPASLGSAGSANYNSSAPTKKVISKTRLAGQVNQDGQKNAAGSQTVRVKSNRKRGRKSKSKGKAG